MLPGNGGPHAIFLPRQKRQASGGFFSGVIMKGKELRPIDGDCADFKRNSVGGDIDGQAATGNVSDGLGCDWALGSEESMRSDN